MRKPPRKNRPEERSPSRSGSARTGTRSGLHEPPRGDEGPVRPGGSPGSKIVRIGTVPSGRAAEAARRLKPLGNPRRVKVTTDPTGAPLRVSPGRGWRSVLTVRERWRIDDEWWRETLSREYFEVVLQDGRVVELYRDLERDTWYAHGGGSAFADR